MWYSVSFCPISTFCAIVSMRFGDVLVHRHSAAQYTIADDAAAEHNVVDARSDQGCHGWHQARIVLVIRVHHDHNVSPELQRLGVAGLLIAPVPEVPIMRDNEYSELLGNRDGVGHLLASSTRMMSSMISIGISARVFSSVSAAL